MIITTKHINKIFYNFIRFTINFYSSIITSNLLFVTDNGRAKRTEGAQFDVTRKKVAAVKTGDVPVMVKPADEEGFVVARSEKGYFVRVKVGDISIQGKGAGYGAYIHTAVRVFIQACRRAGHRYGVPLLSRR